MKNKLKGRGGYSLTELLIVVAIVALIAAAGAAVTTAVLSSRNSMIEAADSQILGSTAAQAIADELRFGQNIVLADGAAETVTLDSTEFGTGVEMTLSDGKLIIGGKPVLADSAYSGLKIKTLTFEKKDEKSVTVKIAVSGRDGEEKWNETFTVVPLNGFGS